MSVYGERDVGQPPVVRVECEAVDCGALLEVEVPSHHNSSTPLIVRCGNCQRLLEVWLHVPYANPDGAHLPIAAECPPAKRPESHVRLQSPRTGPVQRHNSAPVHGNFAGQGYVPQLIRPPPLSRFLLNPTGQGQGDQFVCRPSGMPPGNQYGLHSAASFGDRSSGQHPSFSHIQNDACAAMIAHTFQSIDDIDGRHDFRDEEYGVGGKSRKGKKIRNPSPYNVFMSEEVKRIKAEQPAVDHKQAFKMAARHWAKSPHDCRRIASMRTPSSQIVSGGSSAVGLPNSGTPQTGDPTLEVGAQGVLGPSAPSPMITHHQRSFSAGVNSNLMESGNPTTTLPVSRLSEQQSEVKSTCITNRTNPESEDMHVSAIPPVPSNSNEPISPGVNLSPPVLMQSSHTTAVPSPAK